MPNMPIPVPAHVQPILDRVIQREGGYVDHPADPGGATNLGITLKTLREWRAPDQVSKDDVRRLTHAEASQIYYQRYYLAMNAEAIKDEWNREFVLDWYINAGPRSIQHLQKWLKLPLNVRVTKELADKLAEHSLDWYEVMLERIRFYINITEERPANIAFLEGWFNRTIAFR